MSSDRYRDFRQLARHEQEGCAFRRVVVPRPSTVAIVAPHGGRIEPGTSPIARAIAAEDYALYLFEGLKPGDNRHLHITSANFDDPQCLGLISRSRLVLTVHGCRDWDVRVYVGGRHQQLARRLVALLNRHHFPAELDRTYHAGIHTRNICNRGTLRQGVQLELSAGLRRSLLRSPRQTEVRRFAGVIRAGLGTAV